MSEPSNYTIGWICAIHTEYVAARAFLDEKHPDPTALAPNDGNAYTLGRIGKHNVVIAVLPDGEYGTSSAAVVARDMLHSFHNIRLGLMVGIGGGAPTTDPERDIRLGDVVVSSSNDEHGGVLNYDFGKVVQGQDFRMTGFLNRPPWALRTAISQLKAEFDEDGSHLGETVNAVLAGKPNLKKTYGRPPPETDKLFLSHVVYDNSVGTSDPELLVPRPQREDETEPAVFYGLIASANKLMKDATIRDRFAEEGVLCFEMEAAGLMNHFPCLVIRGICDYSDSHKNKQWQGYAAMVAAAYAKALICRVHQTRLESEKTITEMMSNVKDIKADVSEIKQRINSKALDRLMVADGAEYDTYNDQHEPRCHPETRVKLLREIRQWAEEPSDRKRIYWLSGMAGTGKSTIARTIAKSFDGTESLGATFFFRRGEVKRSNASLLFSTIARQLARNRPELLPHLLEVVEQEANISSKNIVEQFHKLILEPLTKTRTRPLIIVLDALDECSAEKDIEFIVSAFSTLVKSQTAELKVFLTSRPELAVHYAFDRISGYYEEIKLHQVDPDIIYNDLRVFLRDELAEIKNQWNGRRDLSQPLDPDWPGEKRLEILVHTASPLFIFAATMCRFIGDGYFGSPEKQLSILIQAAKSDNDDDGVYDKLAATYLPVLRQFEANRSGSERERLLKRFQQIVGTIVLIEESLSPRSIASLIDIPTDEVSLLLSLLGSVLDTPKSLDLPIRLFHLSFRDFLLSPAALNFRIGFKQTHDHIRLYCLSLLSTREPLQYNLCNLKPGDHRLEALEHLQEHISFAVQYACVHLVYHIQQSETSLEDDDVVHQFLRAHLLHWLEVLSILGEVSQALEMPDKLMGLINPVTDRRELFNLLEDLKWFIPNSISNFVEYPLQLYWSALVFSPSNSLVRKTFKNSIPKCISFQTSHKSYLSPLIRTFRPNQMDRNDEILSIGCLAVSPDSTTMACGYGYRYTNTLTIQLWSISTGETLRRITLNARGNLGDTFNSLVFCWDSKRVVSAALGKFWIHNTNTGALEHTIPMLAGKTLHIDASRHSDLFVSGHHDSTATLWKPSTGEKIRVLLPSSETKRDWISNNEHYVGFSDDSRRVAGWFAHDNIYIWDVNTGNCIRTLSLTDYQIFAGSSFVPSVQNMQGVARISDIYTCRSPSDEVSSRMAISQEAKLLAFRTYDLLGKESGLIHIQNLSTGQCYRTITVPDFTSRFMPNDDLPTSLIFSRDGNYLIQGDDQCFRIWSMHLLDRFNTDNVAESNTLGVSADTNKCYIRSSADESILVSTHSDGKMKLWSTRNGQLIHMLNGSNQDAVGPTDIAISPNTKYLYVSGSWGQSRMWNISLNFELDHSVLIQGSGAAIFSADSKFIAISSNLTYGLGLWDVVSGMKLKHDPAGQAPMVLLPDGKTLVYSTSMKKGFFPQDQFPHWIGEIRLLSMEKKVAVNFCYICSHECDRIQSLAISPDSTWIALAIGRRFEDPISELSLWLYDTGKSFLSIKADASMLSMGFSSCSSKLATSHWDGSIRIRSVPEGQCIYTYTTRFDHRTFSLSFASDDSSLITEHGRLHISKVRESSRPASSSVTLGESGAQLSSFSEPQFCGYRFSDSMRWITWNGQNIMRLPEDAFVSDLEDINERKAIGHSTLTWIDGARRLWIVGFSPDIAPFYSN